MNSHLWEYDHPFYGAHGERTEATNFEELKQWMTNHHHDGSTVIYRWDWLGPRSRDGRPHDPERLIIFGLFPRKAMCFSLSCPITKDQEHDVRQWLLSPDVLGHLTRVWEPLLKSEPSA